MMSFILFENQNRYVFIVSSNCEIVFIHCYFWKKLDDLVIIQKQLYFNRFSTFLWNLNNDLIPKHQIMLQKLCYVIVFAWWWKNCLNYHILSVQDWISNKWSLFPSKPFKFWRCCLLSTAILLTRNGKLLLLFNW